ncbi:MAG: hypothetical protein R6X10_12870 [Desulfobacterales bacterium]
MPIIWKKFNMILFTAIFMMLFLFQSVRAEEKSTNSKTMVVIGTGIIKENNVAGAREQAISESLVTAVGVVMADVVPLEVFVPNFEALNEIIYKNTENFISGYRVLAETKHKNLYRVVVQAGVSVVKIKQQMFKIGIMIGEKVKPRILLLVAEQNVGDLVPGYWWRKDASEKKNIAETILAKIFMSKGFMVMEHVTPHDFTENSTLFLETPDPELKAVMALARHFQADMVVMGHASAEQTPNTMGENLRSFKGSVLIKAIRTSKQEEIGKSFQSVITVNSDEVAGGVEAISQAASLAGKDLAIQITSSFKRKKDETVKIKVIVEGTRVLTNFVKFRNVLSSLNNVKEIQSSEMKADRATVIVEYNGDANTLAEMLMSKSFETFGINISEVLPDQLKVVLVPVGKIKKPGLPATKLEPGALKK